MLAILTTHPIQYQVPLWQALAADGRVPFEVWYLTDHAVRQSHDREFNVSFAWDIDLLGGYPSRFLDVVPGAKPGSFWKCRLRERLRTRLRQSGATALWIQGWQVAAYWQAVREARAAGVEVWLRGESNDLASVPPARRFAKRLALSWLFRRVDRFLYIGSANKRLYCRYGVPESRLHPAPYAVDNDRFAKQAYSVRPHRAEIRRRWGIADDAFCILFCGKLIAKKRPVDLLAAAELLMKGGQLSKIHLLFAGTGPLGAELRSKCQVVLDAERSTSTGIRQSTSLPAASFIGFLNQTEITDAYVAADCLALPSDHGETWGLVVNEAMASGLPCVVSEACGCAEDLIRPVDQKCAFHCGDVQGLAAALLHIRAEHSGKEKWTTQIACHSYRPTIETIGRLMHVESHSSAKAVPEPCRS